MTGEEEEEEEFVICSNVERTADAVGADSHAAPSLWRAPAAHLSKVTPAVAEDITE